LKKKLGPYTPVQIELPLLDEEGKLVLEFECILEVQTKILCSRSTNEYLIKWRNLPKDEATWENEYFRSRHSSLPILQAQSISGRNDL
jgi:hypothetical protein